MLFNRLSCKVAYGTGPNVTLLRIQTVVSVRKYFLTVFRFPSVQDSYFVRRVTCSDLELGTRCPAWSFFWPSLTPYRLLLWCCRQAKWRSLPLTNCTVQYSLNDIRKDGFWDTDPLLSKPYKNKYKPIQFRWGQTVLFGFFKYKSHKTVSKINVKLYDFILRISYEINDSSI